MRPSLAALVGLAALAAPGCFRTIQPAERIDEAPAPGQFPNALLGEVLAARVDDAGLVDYKGIQEDRAGLDRYTSFVAAFSPADDPELFPSKNDKLAYYINAYNAYAITAVIDRPGLNTVIDDKVDFFYFTRYRLGKDKLSLFTLENGVVRPEFSDPRVHFALNCQSAGCPRLPAEAFDAAGLDEQLDGLTHEFVTNPDKVRVAEDGALEISQIFEWYADDFAAAGGAVAFINLHGGGVPADATVRFIPYDWTLTAQDGRRP